MNSPFRPMHGGGFKAQRCGLLSSPKWYAVGEFYILISSFMKLIAPKVDHLSMCGDSRIAALISLFHGAWSMNGPPLSFTGPSFSLLHGEWFSMVLHAAGNVTVIAWRNVRLHGEDFFPAWRIVRLVLVSLKAAWCSGGLFFYAAVCVLSCGYRDWFVHQLFQGCNRFAYGSMWRRKSLSRVRKGPSYGAWLTLSRSGSHVDEELVRKLEVDQ